MTNHEIADYFELLSKIMDIHGADSFRAKSYAAAAFRIEKLPEQLADMDLAQLKATPAIGASLASKIEELNQTGSMKILEEYLANTPPGVVDMLKIKGIGPKKISLLWKELGIESIGELEYACQENRLTTIKGFGAKTQASILESIQFIKSNSGFCLYAEADVFVQQLLDILNKKYPDYLFSPNGAFRQQLNVMNSIDFLTTLSKEQLIAALSAFNILKVVDDEAESLQIQLEGLPEVNFILFENETEYYVTLFETSAADEFINAFNDEFGYPDVIESEEEIFEFNELEFVPPALRTSAKRLEEAASQNLPDLIQPEDIKGIIHSHSTYSDGQHTLQQMALAAKEKGYEYLVISDHSQAAFYANGLSPERIFQQHAEIDKLNQSLAPFKIFKSIEADILNDGKLDYDDAVLSSFDLVIASVHSNLKMDQDKAMQRLLTAIQNPLTRILGHPTGRLLLSRAGYPVDHKMLIDACAHYNVAIEINAHPRRLDLDWTWIEYALSQNVLLSINPDAHSIEGMDLVKYGVLSAQKGGLQKTENVSSFSLNEFESFLKDRKFRVK